MARKQQRETQEEQSERFEREVRRLIDAGELSLTDAAQRLDELLSASRTTKDEERRGE